MATVIIDENTPQDGTEFIPFDESRSSLIKKAGSDNTLSSGSNPSVLTEVNQFRQGIEITTEAYRFQGSGPKIWAGNIKGYTSVRTIGQALSFTEDQNNKAFLDKQNFNPVEYVENSAYPLPIIFNEGPQQTKEASIQAFSLPFWTSNNEGDDNHAHAVRGNVADGNQDLRELKGSNNRICQFIRFNDTGLIPFLDEGQSYYGETPIIHEGYLNDSTETSFIPYDDLGNEKLIDKLNTTDNTLLNFMRTSSSLNLDNDIRQTHGIRSATAGTDVYGPDQGQYGTDSIVFAGFFRGS